MSEEGRFELPKNIKNFLEKLSQPIDDQIKKKKNKEIIQNDYLLIASRIDFILERIYDIISNPPKNKSAQDQDFNMIQDLLLMLFSNVVLIFCITATGWCEMNKMGKKEMKKMEKLLNDINSMGKKIMEKHRRKT